MEKQIIVNQIQTPDGTILVSRHRHDYVTYKDKNGHEYMVDGGNDYLRRNVHKTEYTFLQKIKNKLIKTNDPLAYKEFTIYSDTPFEVIREHYCRGGRGKDGDQPLTWVPLSKMSDEWLKACIEFNEDNGTDKGIANKMYKKELKYRKDNFISIKD